MSNKGDLISSVGCPTEDPYIFLRVEFTNATAMFFANVIDMYENTKKVVKKEDKVDERNGINGVGFEEFPMNEVDKLFLNNFGIGVAFKATLEDNSFLNCEDGYIYCAHCQQYLYDEILDVEVLHKYGADLIHLHISDIFDSLGFTTENSINKLLKDKPIDFSKTSRCQETSDYDFNRRLFLAMQIDSQKSRDVAKRYSTNAVLFVRSALKCYFSSHRSMYKRYIPRAIKKYEEALLVIRQKILGSNKKLDRATKNYIHMFYKLHFDYGRITNIDYMNRQKQLEKDILSNPKPIPKEKKPMKFMGEDMELYKTAAERNDIRAFYRDKQLKFNWHTLERVSKKKRNKNNPVPECSIPFGDTEHWVGTSTVNGRDIKFVVSYDMIPEKYTEEKWHIFPISYFLENNELNHPYVVPEASRKIIKKIYDEYAEGIFTYIRMTKDEETGEKRWEGKTAKKGITYKDGINEDWLSENFKTFYRPFFDDVMEVENIWHQVPVGVRSDVEGLEKIEDNSFVSIYLGNSHKCAFANMANALYEIYDYEAAEFFQENIYKDSRSLITLLNENIKKKTDNDFMIAVRLLQSMFGYVLTKLKTREKLKGSQPFGQIKYVTLLASIDGYKHVISVVGNRIVDTSNRKKLILCKENIAWCASKTLDELDQCKHWIECGYRLDPPNRRLKYLKKRRDDEAQKVDETEDKRIIFRTQKVPKKSKGKKRKAIEK